MKKCILTFQDAKNYGAVLQAYALNYYLNENFGETEVLNYNNVSMNETYNFPKFKLLFKKPKQYIFRFIQFCLFHNKYKKIDLFKNKFLNLTPKYEQKNIFKANDSFDCFIAGSDQIWNYKIINKDLTYFLDFVEKNRKKISYAASFGIIDIPNKFKKIYGEKLKSFDAISIRENEGKKVLLEMGIDVESEVNIDPTLLLSQTHWKKFLLNNKFKKKYILVYKITKADKLLNYAKKLSKKTGYKIVYVPNDFKDGFCGKTKFNIGVEEWLTLIYNAEYVITNSFHGTVFSILFEKMFFVEISKKVNPSTSRLNNLITMLNLNKRIIDYDKDIVLDGINYNHVKSVISQEIERTNMYFKNAFKED